MDDLERVQPDPVKRAIVRLADIIADHLREHIPDMERDETFSSDMQALHDIRREFDSRIVVTEYVDTDWNAVD